MLYNLLCGLLASDWLAFAGAVVGALIGAIITLLSVRKTIKFEAEKSEKSEKNAIRPWLLGCVEYKDINGKDFDAVKKEFKKLEDTVVYFYGGKWVSDVSFDNIPQEVCNKDEKRVVIFFTVRNVGMRTAVHLYFKVSEGGTAAKPTCLSAIAVDGIKLFVIIFKQKELEERKKLRLSFIYTDISESNAYEQYIDFQAKEKPEGVKIAEGGYLKPPKQIDVNQIPNLKNQNKENQDG